MEERKIIKFYRYKEKDENDREIWLYCYGLEDEKGKVTYHFTKDDDKAIKICLQYLNDNYSRVDYRRRIAEKPSIFNLNCSSLDDVSEKVQETSVDEKKEMKNFIKAQEKFYENDFEDVEEKKGKVTRACSWLANFAKDRIAGFKNASKKGKAARIVATVAAVALFVNGCSAILNRGKSPTNSGLSSTTGLDNDNNNDNDNNMKNDIDSSAVKISDTAKEAATIANKALEDAEAKIKDEEEDKKITQIDNTSNNTSNNKSNDTSYDNSKSTSSSHSNGTTSTSGGSSSTSTKPKKESGSVNKGYLAVQDPSASLDDSKNNSSNGNDSKPDADDSYQNVNEEETPITGGDITTDEDYSEEIEVPAKEDAILDSELAGSEGAIDDDVSYDINLDDNNGEYDNVYVEELPDPNKTAEAGDKDYVTTDEELKQDTSLEDESQNSDVVPVEQTPVQDTNTDEYTVSVDTTYTEPGTVETVPVEQSPTINEQEVERAVEAMANGEEGNVIVNTDGSISFEAAENTETNSMTK